MFIAQTNSRMIEGLAASGIDGNGNSDLHVCESHNNEDNLIIFL